ncbi:AAA family ATPase [Actinomadura barringtoniae]|uniref:AAA family ATPase n=1 Tax=Actinomadura barringtoniae TaxID=1427535 RepID=A0A939PGM1_9ACTN|nr:AAA family ATPase [Actinomadura barringtoniae]MBO2451907.1 AAA family ATPase [Actinomadura barringtoniae]
MSARTISPVLVGRPTELALLEDALRAAEQGTPGAVLVGGEAGVGKTRLTKEFGARARAGQARVLVGGCLELGADGLPFAPFTAALRELVREISVEGVAELLPGGSASGLSRLLPEFGEPDGDISSGQARARLFELVLTLLERLSEASPVVLVIEDAHWADQSTRELVTFLIRNLGGSTRLLIVITFRTDELTRSHPLRPLLTELDRAEHVHRIELARLRRDEVTELVASILGEEGPPQIVDEIFARSEGNPLFVEALLDAGSGAELPGSLRDLLLAAVQRLPEDTQEILRVASAGGARIEHDLLSAIAGLDEMTLTRGLRPAVAANVLVVEGDGYSFRHALIREAIHDDLLPGERTRLHARYAECLSDEVPGEARAVEVAHHWFMAHSTVKALVSAWDAIGATERSLAYAESLQMASRVLELWDEVPGAAERIGATHAEVLERAVKLASDSADSELGIKLATAALKEVSDPLRVARLLELRGQLAMQIARPESLVDLREAARIAPADPPNATRARVLATLAMHLDHYADPATDAESDAAAEEALAIAEEVGEPSVLIQINLRRSWLNMFRDDDVDAALALLETARVQAEEAKAYRAVLRAMINKSDVMEAYGMHEEAADAARRGLARAEEVGLSRTSGSVLTFNLVEPLISLGRWDEALTLLEQSLRHLQPSVYRGGLCFLAGDLAVARGDLSLAADYATAARGLIGHGTVAKAQDLFPVCRVEALILLARGKPAEAFETLRPVLEERGLRNSSRYGLPALIVAATACSETGDTEALEAVRTRTSQLRVYGPVEEAHHLTFEAEAARAEGRLDKPAWEAAARAWDALNRPYDLAQALYRQAEATAAGGDRDSVAPALQRAAQLADGLGVTPLLDRINDLARRTRVSLGGSDITAEAPRLGLTPREEEVLRLVAAGRSNREIAEGLFISVKTASVHVSNILAKLGVSSRGEAAAKAHGLHLFED